MEEISKSLCEFASMQGHSLEIQSKNKCDMVMDKILEFVTTGDYKPGDRLPPENFFTERFNVSRVTVRESIKKLSSMGVVTVKHGQGTFVNKISPSTLMLQLYPLMMLNKSDLGQLYDARICLESGIAGLAAKNRTQEDLDKLNGLVPLMNECIKDVNVERYNQLDMEFHTLIGNAAKNDILLMMYKMLNEVRKRGILISNRTLEAITQSIQVHATLLKAIEQQDVDGARATMMEHIIFSKSAAVKQFEE